MRRKRKKLTLNTILITALAQTASAVQWGTNPSWTLQEEGHVGQKFPILSYNFQGSSKIISVQIWKNNKQVKDRGEDAALLKRVGKYFGMSRNSVITQHRIDREEICAKTTRRVDICMIVLEVVTTSPKGEYDVQLVNVLIKDKNDNRPKFPHGAHDICAISVSENTALDTIVPLKDCMAYDADGTSVITYSIGDDQPFELVQTSVDEIDDGLELKLTKALDFEGPTPTHDFWLTATDGVNSDKKLIQVTVLDENDNKPYFEKRIYTVFVEENTPLNRNIVSITATDRDKKATLHYRIAKRSNSSAAPFKIDERTGDVTLVKPLDYEAQTEFSFYVQVSDEKHRAQTVVNIAVKNVNDNLPQIAISPVTNAPSSGDERAGRTGVTVVEVEENKAGGTLLATVRVSDEDIVESELETDGMKVVVEPAGLPFKLSRLGSKPFHLALEITKPLDYEIKSSYKFNIKACEVGQQPTKCATKPIQLNLIDMNDNAPTCPRDQTRNDFEISEAIKPGFSFGEIGWHDPDSEIFQQQFRLLSSKSNVGEHHLSTPFEVDRFGKLAVSEKSGEQYLLDYEKAQNYTLSVQILDGVRQSLQADQTPVADFSVVCEVRVNLQDVNDNEPQFNQPFGELRVPKRLSQNVCRQIYFSAFDLDSGENQKIVYKIASNVDLFSIDPHTAEFSIRDHERLMRKLREHKGDKPFTQKITATDGGHPRMSTTMTLHIVQASTADSCPTFVELESDAVYSRATTSLDSLEIASILIGVLLVFIIVIVFLMIFILKRPRSCINRWTCFAKDDDSDYSPGSLRPERYSGGLLHRMFADSSGKRTSGSSDFYSVRDGRMISHGSSVDCYDDRKTTRRGDQVVSPSFADQFKYDLNLSSGTSDQDHVITVTDKSLAKSSNDVVIMFDTTLGNKAEKAPVNLNVSTDLTSDSYRTSNEPSEKMRHSTGSQSSAALEPLLKGTHPNPSRKLNAMLTTVESTTTTRTLTQHMTLKKKNSAPDIYSARSRLVQTSATASLPPRPMHGSDSGHGESHCEQPSGSDRAVPANGRAGSSDHFEYLTDGTSHSTKGSRDKLAQRELNAQTRRATSTSSASSSLQPETSQCVLGPMCTHNCLLSGHSDTCWVSAVPADGRQQRPETLTLGRGAGQQRQSTREKRTPVLRPARKSGLISSL